MMTAPEVYSPSRKRRKRDRNEDEILVRVSTNQVFLAWLPPRIYSGSLTEYGPRALLYFALKLLGLVSTITVLYMSEVKKKFFF